ncbi:MAG: hypothetical protein ACM34K_19740 [Bacillota bacterium]
METQLPLKLYIIIFRSHRYKGLHVFIHPMVYTIKYRWIIHDTSI